MKEESNPISPSDNRRQKVLVPTSSRWAPLLEIDWSIKKYEVVLIVFGIICTILIWQTPLPFSSGLAASLVFRVAKFLLAVYLIGTAIVIIRMLVHRFKTGVNPLTNAEAFIETAQPYFTLNFLMLSIRRGVAILGTIFFFLHLKHVILIIHEANFDLFFWNLDRTIHFGVQPNTWMMENFGTNHDVAILSDFMYKYYFHYLIAAAIVFLLELKGRELTEKFFFAYTLLWSIGGLGYLVAPADGPCYAVLSSLSAPANEQEHLFYFPITQEVSSKYVQNYRDSKIWIAKNYQEELWTQRYHFLVKKEKLPGMFYGIAAMPSLHVAAVAFITIFYFLFNPILGLCGLAFAVLTFLSSIFLQWHYAIDGYVGILMAIVASSISLKYGGARWVKRSPQEDAGS